VLENELAADRAFEDVEGARECPACHGSRLNAVARHVRVQGHTIDNFTALSAAETWQLIEKLRFRGNQKTIAADLVPEISSALSSWKRRARLSRTRPLGEDAQRRGIAAHPPRAQLGSNLRGVLYVLDEPTIGLHPRDNVRCSRR
jgi:excinuclease ABC subunit A